MGCFCDYCADQHDMRLLVACLLIDCLPAKCAAHMLYTKQMSGGRWYKGGSVGSYLMTVVDL
jgi:hypothetical protein